MINKFLRSTASAVITAVLLTLTAPGAAIVRAQDIQPENYTLTQDDETFLRNIEKDTVQYFLRYSDVETGLTRDSSKPGSPASVAATGFSLASLAIAAEHGWISKKEAASRIERTLITLKNRAEHKNGFFYHFLDPKTAKRTWRSEASSVDTAICVAGALLAAQYFKGTQIEILAHQIYKRINWAWMLNGSDFVCMGWTPEGGFLPYYWDVYSEHIIIQALAIGSTSYPIPARLWERWMRHEENYNGYMIVFAPSGSLFTYQMAQAFIDFQNLHDDGINYSVNSRDATLANRLFCINNMDKYAGYSEKTWGLTACVGPNGYKAYGAKPGNALHDGTIAPYGSASSLPFTPKESLEVLRYLYGSYKEKLYGRYGFLDSFNLDKNWWADEYLGIDQGLTVLAIENTLGREVWKKFMELECIQRWIELARLNKKNNHPA
ncbi:MAG: glucoamylase family protein [Candidatus Omnitrophica bacterium]|nr:glucoamylase family protein [Candidatus Omnitrophota bacterium]